MEASKSIYVLCCVCHVQLSTSSQMLYFYFIDIKFNNDMYHEFKTALTYEIDDDISTTNPFPNFSRNSLERNMDFWRRNRDMLIIFTGVYYLLNIVDAHIFAHLNEFEVNNKLSFKVKPSLDKINSSNLVGVSFYFSF